MSEKIRVIRVVEYVGEREAVEAQVKKSIHGTERWSSGVEITAATIHSLVPDYSTSASVDNRYYGVFVEDALKSAREKPLVVVAQAKIVCQEGIETVKKAVVEAVKNRTVSADLRTAADRAFRFFGGLSFTDATAKVQREVVEVVRELGRALRPEQYKGDEDAEKERKAALRQAGKSLRFGENAVQRGLGSVQLSNGRVVEKGPLVGSPPLETRNSDPQWTAGRGWFWASTGEKIR